jgi:two-component system chemotaxis sensor kinase CheA
LKEISAKLRSIYLAEQREHVSRMRALLGAAEAGTLSAAALEELLRRAHTLKGAARTVGLAPVEGLAHRMENVLARVREGALRLDQAAREVIERALEAVEDAGAALEEEREPVDIGRVEEEIEEWLAAPHEAAAAQPAPERPSAPAAAGLDTVRVRAEDLDALLRSSTQLVAGCQDQNRVSRQLTDLCRQLRELEQAWERFRGTAARIGRDRGERAARGGATMELFEEQIRSAARLAGLARRAQQRGAWEFARLIDRIEQDTSRIRMAPAEAVFEGFRKMVRELARDEGKEVEFRGEGLEVQADRLVLQTLKDPVMHLLRNAVCHGIEPAEERMAAGKERAGRIVLRVEARADRLHVGVDDDGRGIDLKAVAEAATRRGLIVEGAAGSRSLEEFARLILEPGLSTARSITRLSGRGMGLAVVHEEVRRLRGDVRLRHEAGAGTSVLLSVPLSVSRHHIVLVASRGQVFGLPTHAIERLCRVRRQEVQMVEGQETIRVGGRAAPLVRLEDLLEAAGGAAHNGSKAAGDGEGGRRLPAALLRCGEQGLALVVDALLDERNAVVKESGLTGPQAGMSAGGVLLEDGTVALVLDPAELWDAFRKADRRPAAPAETAPKKPPAILVVDDSVTTRSLEKSILEAHGYRVRVAVDGVDALAQLRTERPDLVIADILMPRLDGFGLLEQMKRDKDLARIPVIVVSSLERAQDQQRGLGLGADAYMVKRKFDQRELLEAVRQLL